MQGRRPAPGSAGNAEFVIRSNRSLSPAGNRLFFCLMAAVSFSIAGAFAAFGLWLVLPFAGLEMLALAAALALCCRRAAAREIIRIAERTVDVRIERPLRAPLRWRCPRAWTRACLERAAVAGHPSRLLLRSHGRSLAIGACLTDAERAGLARALNAALSREAPCAA